LKVHENQLPSPDSFYVTVVTLSGIASHKVKYNLKDSQSGYVYPGDISSGVLTNQNPIKYYHAEAPELTGVFESRRL
jgi:hypothetical protein